jgi:DNA excision repair protein ERCC-8
MGSAWTCVPCSLIKAKSSSKHNRQQTGTGNGLGRCMNSYLLSRSLGLIGPQALQRLQMASLLESIQAAPNIKFDSTPRSGELGAAGSQPAPGEADITTQWAHRAGVNTLAIDRFQGRQYVEPFSLYYYRLRNHSLHNRSTTNQPPCSLLSGGADSSIHLWDLERAENTVHQHTHRSIGSVAK